jgi:hypothetical protein
MVLELSDQEVALVRQILDHALDELRVEVRRTRTPDFHDDLVEQEAILKGLIARIPVEAA